jgi:outer membrane immunogenic protein
VFGEIGPPFHMSGALGGFNVGCQYQSGWWLIGVEGDGAVTNKDGQAANFFRGKGSLTGPREPFVSQTTERWMATARLRLGWAADKWLFFITGGGAWSGVEVSVWSPSFPSTAAHHKRTLTGWTVGAGYEYALGYGWSWKSEFLYIDYGWSRFFDPAVPVRPTVRPS